MQPSIIRANGQYWVSGEELQIGDVSSA